jgi:hypothetical protein
MGNLKDAIEKLKTASGLLLGGEKPKQYTDILSPEIKLSGTVEQAWKDVGKHLWDIFTEVNGKRE